MNDKDVRTHGNLDFKTPSNEVSAKALVRTVDALDSALDEISSNFSKKKRSILKVRPFREGSLIIPFELAICDIGTDNNDRVVDISMESNLDTLNMVLQTLSEYISAKIFLGGNRPKSIDRVGDLIILHNENDEIVSIPFYTWSLIENSRSLTDDKFSIAFSAIDGDEIIDSVTLSTSEFGTIFSVERKY